MQAYLELELPSRGVSTEARECSAKARYLYVTWVKSIAPINRECQESLERRFYRLKKEWELDTAHYSSMQMAATHHAYQEIINLGEAVVPLMVRDMMATETHWFFALATLTGENPVPAQHAGHIPSMVQDWQNWAVANQVFRQE